jgi:anti-anti-sigma factor
MEKIGAVPVAHVDEDIDAANVAAIQLQLADALGPDALSLVVDLSDTRYVDSAGMDMLLRLGDRLDRRRARLILVIPDASQLRRLIAIVGLPEAVAVRSSLAEALREAERAQARAPTGHGSPQGQPGEVHCHDDGPAQQGTDDEQRASLSDRRGDELP